MLNKYYLSGKSSGLIFLLGSNKNNLSKFSLVSEIDNRLEVKKIVLCVEKTERLLVWKGTNKLELYQGSKGILKYTIENEQIKDIQAGELYFLILTKSGKLYSLADGSTESETIEIPFSDPELSNFDSLREVTFFSSKKLKVATFRMSNYTNYYICNDGALYASGWGEEGEIGNGENTNQQLPVFVADDVTKVFTGKNNYNFFYVSKQNKLFGCGYNTYFSLANEQQNNRTIPVEITVKKDSNIEPSQIEVIECTSKASFLLTNEGKLFSCGSLEHNGHDVEKTKYEEIPLLKEKKIIKIGCGDNYILALSSENKLYGWGFSAENIPTDQFLKKGFSHIPIPLNVPEPLLNISPKWLTLACGYKTFLLYCLMGSNIKNDFKMLFESNKFCDSVINTFDDKIIPIHKLLIELRANLKINKIQEIVKKNNFGEKEINIFLKWIYFDEITETKTLELFFKALNLSFPPNENENSLELHLSKLYKDEDSKNFFILVKDDEDENEDEEKDEDEENYEEIPVHKLILVARSGLFREMFDNLNEKEKKLNQIKDYSEKSIDSLEILIKFLYTDKLELTADHDPELIVEELEDAVEYYQLNENSNLNHELILIKKKLHK
ncbi:hypothetical protein M0813_15986 [Anaeramoeba flamelloides]|uniref:BTB domain-containing protein n=1 Tax=Anaeramoeba flamelloides TaxID=1746091 RepID=A0ABQ8Z115_9EUKA|nr:hypothetical protein M0813_15986 [Anaeramoeba flamelloides]